MGASASRAPLGTTRRPALSMGRGEFRALLTVLLEGEDAEFGAYIRGLAAKESPTGSLLLSS